MKTIKILNLYACLGGNRYKWDEVADNLEITAIELDPEAARLYKERFPNDKVIIADAHQYLIDHFKEFDFIWSSPPCPTHSRARYWNSSNYDTTTKPIYPDLKLYEEILFLQHYYKNGKFVVENVILYYEPLIPAQKRGRHLYWTNFNLPTDLKEREYRISGNKENPQKDELKNLCKFHDYNFNNYNGTQLIIKMARNLVDYEAGKTILETALGIIRKKDEKQTSIFDFL